MGIILFHWPFQGCMVSPLIRRFLLKLLCYGKGWRKGEVGMFVLLEILVIKRWMKGCIFFVFWEPILFLWRLEIE